MSGFTIPGLGFAKPNETLPPLSPETSGTATNTQDTASPSATASASEASKAPVSDHASAAASTSGPGASADAMNIDNPPSPPSLTSALEAALGTAEPITTDQDDTAAAVAAAAAADGALLEATLQRPQQPGESAHPEWEEDSSPYESSSDSSSSDDSSDDDDDDKEPYELLGVEETARMLMEAGSDDEGDGSKPGASAGIRSKNEVAVEPVPKPDVTITPDMKVEDLGVVEQVVETIVVIRGFTPGEYQVLDTGSVLCTEDRAVFGAVAETIGKVLQPMYTVMFSSAKDIAAAGLTAGTKVCYPVAHAKYVFTQPLRNVKGSDASNIHDEEVAEDEMEFSDDEKEAEHKKQKKMAKREARGGRGGGGGGGRGGAGSSRDPHPLRNEVKADTTMGGLNYDDEDDGPYKPLARPASFGQGPPIQQGFTQEPEPGSRQAKHGGRGDFRGRGRGRGDRGRGDRGRGRGRGGGQHRGDGYSQGPSGQRTQHQQQQHHQQQQQPQQSQPRGQWNAGAFQAPAQPQAYAPPPVAAAHPFSFAGMPTPPPAQGGGFPAAPPPPPPGWPGAQQNAQGAQAAQFSPAFFAAMLAQMRRSQGQNGQPPPPPQ
ncbi:hypothetical protein BN1723_005421 [Verticillium longisporum]|uniref:H/ACA ribonucleoprotein complex non-core subunit NAF1 n=1 Tax=Verticillium longisporum TaxID=100787 RepID=A0A0G4L108_VERLO|nr:hypothetical protein BN1708_011496 [Verticillium longisporum]CRK42798.1 hypothetical protein BN1723_005421 [Verticillium longisporum]